MKNECEGCKTCEFKECCFIELEEGQECSDYEYDDEWEEFHG